MIPNVDDSCTSVGGGHLDKKEIANKLLSLRGDKAQAEVARAVGISRSALGMYENGNRIPRDYIKEKLANYYGQSVQSLFFTSK